MAPASRPQSPLSLGLGSLSSFLGPALSSHDALPSLSDLSDLSKILRSYKSELSERSSRIDRENSRLSAYAPIASGSGSGSKARIQSQTKASETNSLPLASEEVIGTHVSPGPSSSATTDSARPRSASRQQSGSAAVRSKAAVPSAATPPPPSHASSSKVAALVSPSRSSKGKGVERVSAGSVAGGSPRSSQSPSTSHRSEVVKIKRERDRSVSLLDESYATGETRRNEGSGRREQSIEADDDAPSTGPGRTYAKNKRRKRSDSARQSSALRDSEGEEEERKAGGRHSPSVVSLGIRVSAEPLPVNGSSSTPQRGLTRPLGIRLKLNPSRAPSGIAALGSAHRPTGLRPDHASSMPDGSGFIWTLPEEPAALIPQPPVSRPPKPYSTRPDDVDEDFTATDWKERERQRDREEAHFPSTTSASASPVPGQTHLHKEATGAAISSAAANRVRSQNQQQVTYQAFQAYVDGWFKSLTEEDVAWLGRQEDDSEAFQIPEIGRHYKEVWEEEDAMANSVSHSYGTFSAAVNGTRNGSSSSKSKPHRVGPFDPRQLADEHAFGTSSIEAKGGPLMERVLSLVLPRPPSDEPRLDGQHHAVANGVESQQQYYQQQQQGVNGSSDRTHAAVNGHNDAHSEPPPAAALPPPPPPPSQNMAQYEERLKAELRFLDILGADEEVDWSNRQDDEISTTLRKVQSLLGRQTEINGVRKARLKELAEARLAYQDYLSCLTNVEKIIEQGWYKRQSLLKKLVSKKKGSAKASTSASTSTGGNGSNGTGAGTGPSTRGSVVPILNEHNTRSGTPSTSSAPNTALNAAAAMMASAGVGAEGGPSTSGALTPLSHQPTSPAPEGGGGTEGEASGGAGGSNSRTDPEDPYALYNSLAQNRLGVPPLAPQLLEAMRSRGMLKRALEPIFPIEVKRIPTSTIYHGLQIPTVDLDQ